MLPKQVIIKGSVVSVYSQSGKRKQLTRRKIVEPEWVQLWYEVLDGKFDERLWLHLNDIDRQFMVYCVNATHTHNREFNIHVARDQRIMYDDMRRIEGEIYAGNLNRELVSRYDKIIDTLIDTLQIERKHGSALKNRIQRTFDQQNRD
jgi:hypothetical protein